MDIEKWCRICSIEVKCGVFLFSEEAKQTFLHAKIRKYLSVSVRPYDTPRFVRHVFFIVL